MKENITTKEFALRKEILKMVSFFLLALVMILATIGYMFLNNYVMTVISVCGALSWCWNLYTCITDTIAGIQWMDTVE